MNYYGYDDYGSMAGFFAGMGIVGVILCLAVFVCIVAVYFVLASLIVKAVKEKGYHRQGAGALWFVIVVSFLSVALMPFALVCLGLYAIALPDRGREADAADAAAGSYQPSGYQGYAQPGVTGYQQAAQAGAPTYPQGYGQQQ